MSIQKKSLISTLKTAKKANVASDVKGEKIASMRVPSMKTVSAKAAASTKASFKANFKSVSAKSLKSAKSANLKVNL